MNTELITILCPQCRKEYIRKESEKPIWYWCMKCRKYFIIRNEKMVEKNPQTVALSVAYGIWKSI